MNEGVEILLARMDSHPEEFYDHGPWSWVTDAVMGEFETRSQGMPADIYQRAAFMTDEELAALRDKYQKLQATHFTNRVMQQLLNPPGSYADTMVATAQVTPINLSNTLGVYAGSIMAKVGK